MRLVFKTFGQNDWLPENRLNFEYQSSHHVVLTSEEPSDLAINTQIYYIPPNYYNRGDAAYIKIISGITSLNLDYIAWKNTQAEAPDLSLLIGQYQEFWTAWNTQAIAIQEENTRKILAEETAQTQKIKEDLVKFFPGINEEGNEWSYLDVNHNQFKLLRKTGMTYICSWNGSKWNLTLRSDLIGNFYDVKKSKNLNNIVKFIKESEEVIQYETRNTQEKEKLRKQTLLHTVMKEAGWENGGYNEYIKNKESGRYYARAMIADDSDKIYITSIGRYIESLMLEPHKLDYSIFE